MALDVRLGVVTGDDEGNSDDYCRSLRRPMECRWC